jgi:acetyl-CoA C-acetyltransferase
MSNEVYIVGAKRTPIGSLLGTLADVPATRLGASALKAAVEQSGLAPEAIQELYMGNVVSANLGQAPATQVAIYAGLTTKTPCTQINKVCASGTKAVMAASSAIRLGDQHIIAAGGMESMSQVPFYATRMRAGHKYGSVELVDGIVRDGLQDVYKQIMMGDAGELAAEKYGFTREMQDAYAIRSYTLAQESQKNGAFAHEISPVVIAGAKGDTIVDTDEEPAKVRFDKIPTLKPAFKKDGTITAANAPSLNDGAAAIILASGDAVKQHGLKPLGRVVSWGDAALDPDWFTIAPAEAIPIALKKAGLTISDIDIFEINEAFSVVALANAQILGIPHEKLNVLGGAVALGHPIGCSGARLIVTMLNALRIKGGKYGCLGICNGGGGASALIVENLQ